MKVTVSPTQQSSVLLEIEVPPDKLDAAVLDAVRRLSRRVRVPGFRPGKAPRLMLERTLGADAVMDDAVEHLVNDSFREAASTLPVVPLANPSITFVNPPREGEPVAFKATLQVRPVVHLGDYKNFNFRPEIETIDDDKVAKVIDELRDQNAILTAVEDRAVEKDDYVVIGFEGTRDGEPFEGGSSDRMPLIVGSDRLIPGFEDHLLGMRVGDESASRREFDVTFPEDYAEASLAGKAAHFRVELKEHRAKVLPELSDGFAHELGPYADLDALRADIRKRLERNALDKARHDFAERIIDYAVSNAQLELPEAIAGPNRDAAGLPPILVEQETEVMHDEFRSNLARQGISEEAYGKVTGQSHEELHTEFRPQAEKRVKTLLVLAKVAEAEGVTVADLDVETEVGRARQRYAENKRLLGYFDSERGRNFIRSSLRRSRTVEKLIDEWLATHPEHPDLPHADSDDQRSVVAGTVAQASAVVKVTDPGAIEGDGVQRSAASESAAPAGSAEPFPEQPAPAEPAPQGAAATSGRGA